jgi:hypothetical protein
MRTKVRFGLAAVIILLSGFAAGILTPIVHLRRNMDDKRELGYGHAELEIDARTSPAGESARRHRHRLMIVSGGQSGVDRAALDVAIEYHLPCRGWCPADRWAEDGRIGSQYPLQETGSTLPAVRTEMNVVDSDATLILTQGEPRDGTPLTEEMARKHGRPCITLDLEREPDTRTFDAWLAENNVRVLNIAGPRESFRPGFVYSRARTVLTALLVR